MNRMFKFAAPSAITSALSLLALSGCSHQQPPTKKSIYIQKQQRLVDSLKEGGVQVIQQGARLQLILPVDNFFDLASTKITDYKIDAVQQVALYLQIYIQQFNRPVTIHVSGYSDKIYSPKKQLAESNQYAQAIASYLWSHGFSPKQLHIVGFGSLNPIGDNKTTQGAAFNRRVVIQVN